VNLLKLLTPGKDGQVVLDLEDVVQRGITVVRATGSGQGEKLWPPPPIQVSAAPAAPPAAVAAVESKPKRAPLSAAGKAGLVFAGIAVYWLLLALAPAPIPQDFTVLTLAVVIGFYVIGKVHHALHTPLMSVTNAISGVIVVGALVQVGLGVGVIQVLAGIAILLASINIFGGFAVTRRMLAMFSKGN
jgi:NAD(P) transhydrogenase subunit alpha